MKRKILTACLALTAAAGLAGCTLNPIKITGRLLKAVAEKKAGTAGETEKETEEESTEEETTAAGKGSITVSIPTASSETETETAETSATEEETADEETKNAGINTGLEGPESVISAYVYMSDAGTTLVLQEDHTCIYTEVESAKEELTSLYFGTWTEDKVSKTLDVKVTTIHDYELTAKMDSEESFLLQCVNGQPWSDEVLYLTDMGEGRFLGNYAKDGLYTGYCTGEGCGAGQFESAEIVGKYLQVVGCLDYYTDQNRSSSGMQAYGYSEIWFPVADSLQIYAVGGDGPDEEIEAADLKRVFGPGNATGLEMEVFVQDGKVVKICICS